MTQGRGENHERMQKIQVIGIVLNQGPMALYPDHHNEPFSEIVDLGVDPNTIDPLENNGTLGEDSNLNSGT